jgi:HAD superfamily hydrolase (TIGR01549 family)
VTRGLRIQADELLLVDVGNVLFHDAPFEIAFTFFVHEHLRAEGVDRRWTPRELLERTREPGRRGALERAVAVAWSKTLERWSELSVPVRGAFEALATLSGVRKAILANQPRETVAALARRGATELFEAVFLDSIVGLSKPDPAFFQYVLDQLAVAPPRAWMVGDRADNDLAPAQSLGMRTVWIRPPSLEELGPVADVSAAWQAAYIEETERAASQKPPTPAPDLVFDSFADLARATLQC